MTDEFSAIVPDDSVIADWATEVDTPKVGDCAAVRTSLFAAFFQFFDHSRETRFFSCGGVSMNDPLGTGLIQCFDCFAEESFGILHASRQHSPHDIFTTISHERPASAVPFSSSNVLAKAFFGTGNVRHKKFFFELF